MRAALLTLCALSLACRHRAKDSPDAPPPAHDVAPPLAVADVPVDTPPAPVTAWLTATAVRGAATLDSTLRLHPPSGAPGAHWTLPNDPPAGLSALTLQRGALPGDVIATGRDAELTLTIDEGLRVTLASDASVEVPAYAGASVILTRGVLEARSESGDAVRVDTPSARVIVSSGSCVLGVALDGSVALWASGPGVTVWPSPPAPPPRPTRLSDEERARLRARASHPVLLDVDIPELAAQEVRPIAAEPLAEGTSRVFDPLGGAHHHLLATRPTRAALERWIATQIPAPTPYTHLLPIGQLSRAGAGDLADVRVVMARMRTAGSAMTTENRELLLARMSLAIGRATARARRGRELATRGGDSTALVQLAPVEAITEASWALAPIVPH